MNGPDIIIVAWNGMDLAWTHGRKITGGITVHTWRVDWPGDRTGRTLHLGDAHASGVWDRGFFMMHGLHIGHPIARRWDPSCIHLLGSLARAPRGRREGNQAERRNNQKLLISTCSLCMFW